MAKMFFCLVSKLVTWPRTSPPAMHKSRKMCFYYTCLHYLHHFLFPITWNSGLGLDSADQLPPDDQPVGSDNICSYLQQKHLTPTAAILDWTSSWWQNDSSKMCHYIPVGSSSELKRHRIFSSTVKSGCVSWWNKQTFFALTPKNPPQMYFHSIYATKPTRSWISFPSPWIWMSPLVTEV